MFGTPKSTNTSTNSLFGATKPTSLFGSTNQTTGNTGGNLFGSTQPSSAQPLTGTTGSLFGSTNQQPSSAQPSTLTSGNLFGSTQQQSTNQQQSGGGGLFGSTQASTGTTGGSLFGSTQQQSTTQQNTGGGLFGNTATNTGTTGSSLFGNKPTSLFGSTTAAAPTGGSLFGNQGTTGTTTGGLFGSTTQSTGFGGQGGGLFGAAASTQNQQQQTNQKQLQEIINEALSVRIAVTEPKLYGDDSDGTILRLNQLLAACGVGKGFFDKDKEPIAFDSTNPYFQFRAIGYCALSRHKNSDGLVALILNQPADIFSTSQERQKLIDTLRTILGNNVINPDIHVHIVNIRPLTEKLCEVEIFVTKTGSGKINAKDLSAFLDHPDRAKSKQEKLPQCEKIVPRVEMNEEDIKRYLSTPPKGFSDIEWRQAIIDNPDSKNLLPYPIYGYKELDERRQRQLKERDVQRKSYGQLNDRLKTATQDIQQINGLKKIFCEDAKRLRHRILRIIAATHNNSYQNAVSMEEEQLLSRLETISVCLNAPNRLYHRCEKLHEYLRSNKETLESRKKEASDHQYLTDEETSALKRYLSRRQQDLEVITESLKDDNDDIKIMLKEQF